MTDILERLRNPTSLECGILHWKAADEIERLRAVIRVNALRWGHSHAEIDEILVGASVTSHEVSTNKGGGE